MTQTGARYSILVFNTFTIEGIHSFPNASIVCDQTYLATPHRHMFHFKCWWEVTHTDRDIEFIEKMHEVREYFSKLRKTDAGILDFGSRSCEDLALRVLKTFDAVKVEVSEDGENGAVVERFPEYVSRIPL